ncbi:MAG: hypothetical protein MJ209_00375, partial [archaeon]|nr:hypothetical protein [archaeon]
YLTERIRKSKKENIIEKKQETILLKIKQEIKVKEIVKKVYITEREWGLFIKHPRLKITNLVPPLGVLFIH